MPQNLFEKVKTCLKPRDLAPLIHETFSHQETARLMAAEGVSYPGVRIESVPHEDLTLDWAEDALKNPAVLSGLTRALDKAHEKDIQEMRLLSIDGIERMIELIPGIYRQRRVSGFLWALVRDERPETVTLVRRFLEVFYRFLEKQAREFQKFEKFESHLSEGRLNKGETQKIRQILSDLIADNKELKKTLEREQKDKDKKDR